MTGRSQRHLREIYGIDSSGKRDYNAVSGPPVPTTKPTISGTAKVGQVLTATDAKFDGLTPITVTRVWRANGTPIGSATGTTYTPVSGDIGKLITVVSTGTNSAGTASATSANTAAVVA